MGNQRTSRIADVGGSLSCELRPLCWAAAWDGPETGLLADEAGCLLGEGENISTSLAPSGDDHGQNPMEPQGPSNRDRSAAAPRDAAKGGRGREMLCEPSLSSRQGRRGMRRRKKKATGSGKAVGGRVSCVSPGRRARIEGLGGFGLAVARLGAAEWATGSRAAMRIDGDVPLPGSTRRRRSPAQPGTPGRNLVARLAQARRKGQKWRLGKG